MKKIISLFLLLASFTLAGAQQISLADVVFYRYYPNRIGGLNSMADGEHYSRISDTGKGILKCSFKTGETVATLFDANDTQGERLQNFSDYKISPDGRYILLETNHKAIYRRSSTANWFVYDTNGNWSWTGISDAIADSIDVEAPEISVTKRITVAAGMNLPLDAGNSRDNVKIRSFRWELGNGDTVTGVRPKYAYQKAGTYRIKLTVTDTAGNKAEETIEARILEPTRSGVVYLHVVDEQGSPIPYATYYVKNGSEQTTPCMADETGVITLVYPAGTYTVAVFRDGYMPAEHDVEIETLLEKDDYIPLFEGDVVIGEFHVERLSLQEMIDQGVDLSDPANVNTFTFKTTLTFQQEPIPISWDTREGDIILDMNQDNVKPGGFGTTSHSGGGGGGPEDPKPDSNRKEKVVVSVIGPPEAPVIAVLTTTQSVSWMKSMYQATLTVANTADSKYVLEDSTAEIHLPEGVSLAALTPCTSPEIRS